MPESASSSALALYSGVWPCGLLRAARAAARHPRALLQTLRTSPFFNSATVAAGERKFIQPVAAMHDPGGFGAEFFQRVRHRLDPGGGIDAEQLVIGRGRVGQRAQQIENRADAQLLPHGRDMAHGRMKARRHQETDAALAQAALQHRNFGIDIDAQRRQHVRRAGLRRHGAVAMLGHRHAARGQHESRGGGDIDVPRASPPVPQVSMAPGGRFDALRLGAHGEAPPVISSTVSPFMPQRHQGTPPSAPASHRRS